MEFARIGLRVWELGVARNLRTGITDMCMRKRCGRDGLDCWLGGEPGLLALDAQALHAVFLVGDDLSGKR
jgi:hypothetical protein